MADPLSIAVSAMTMIGACGACAKQLNDLRRAFRDAPAEILALSNEISDMTVVLTEVNTICQEPAMTLKLVMQRTTENCFLICDDSSARKHRDSQFHDLLSAQLDRAKQVLAELATLAESVYNDSHSGARVNKLGWLRKKQGAGKLQAQLKDTREKIHMLLCMKTT